MYRCIAFLFASVALAGCCVSGNGCYAPLPGTPIAWDGLGAAPTEISTTSEYRPRKKARPKSEIIIGPIGGVSAESTPKPQAKEEWAQREAADRAIDEKLTKQLIICRNCLPEPTRDNAR